MKTLMELLGEDPREVFLPKHFSRLPFSRPAGGRAFTNLLNWDSVREIFESKNSVLRIVQDGRVIKDYVEMSYDDALSHFNLGHTLLLRYAERSCPNFKKIAEDFESSFHTPVDVQLYCTPNGHNAFGWHFDVEEVFIIQTKGSKAYSIRPNTVHPNPLVESISKDMGFEKEKSDLEIKVVLEEGDWLYIPSGWWHIAKTQRESMHISIGLMPSSAVDLSRFLPTFLAQDPYWRSRMPIHMNFESLEEEIDFYQEMVTKLGQHLAQKFSTREFVRDFLIKKKKIKI